MCTPCTCLEEELEWMADTVSRPAQLSGMRESIRVLSASAATADQVGHKLLLSMLSFAGAARFYRRGSACGGRSRCRSSGGGGAAAGRAGRVAAGSGGPAGGPAGQALVLRVAQVSKVRAGLPLHVMAPSVQATVVLPSSSPPDRCHGRRRSAFSASTPRSPPSTTSSLGCTPG